MGPSASRYPEVVPERDLANLERIGGRLVCPGDADWPAQLADLAREGGRAAGRRDRQTAGQAGEAGAPYALWVHGPLPLSGVCHRSVALVGCRAATGYGTHVAGELGADLAERGWTVVSGGAYGIDGAAHRGALAVGGATVAVLAGGVDVLYPRGHASLFHRMIEEGLFVSEAPPGVPPFRRRFLTRNRLIAALSQGTVVVEADHRSGALSTARHARRLGRPLMAVPGPVTSATSSGCHHLLRQFREESALVTMAAEVVEEVGRIGELAPRPVVPPGPRDGLTAMVMRVLDAVPARRPAGPAVIARRAAEPVRTVLGVLGPLVAQGLVEQRPEGYRLTALGRSPSAGERAGMPPHGGPKAPA